MESSKPRKVNRGRLLCVVVGSLWSLNEDHGFLVAATKGKQDLGENGATRDTGKQDPKSSDEPAWNIIIARSFGTGAPSIDQPGS